MKKKASVLSTDASASSLKLSKGALRSDTIVKTCMKVLANEGVVGLSYEELGQRLGLNRAHIKYYFSSKEDLLRACFLQVAQTAQQITIETLASRHSWQDRLHGVVDGAFSWLQRHPDHMPILFLYYHYCSIDQKLGATHSAIRAEGRNRIEQIILAEPTGKVKPKRAAQLAMGLQLFITGQIMEAATTNSLEELRPFHRATTSYVEDLIREIES